MSGSGGPEADTPNRGWAARGASADAAGDTAESSRRRHPSRTLVVLVLLAIASGAALWIVPELQVAAARDRLAIEGQLSPNEHLVLEYSLFEAENAARSTLAQILAAGGLLLGLAIVWRRFEISRELRTHERFARAVEQLASERGDGSARTEARLGGIYALERLTGESEREYWPIMEVLTAYVRENAPWKVQPSEHAPPILPQRPPADIQAVLAVLGRRKPRANPERRLLDLRETDLRGANLSGSRLDGVTLHRAHLEQVDATRAILRHSNLREANLSGASLTHTDLGGASLSRASLEGARLNGANLKGADLSGANLGGADLWEADLRGCNLKDADLRGADLSQCLLEEAIMWRADLQNAVLTGAHLRGTHLERANLSGATGLTCEQGDDAYTDENTILPEYLLLGQVGQTLATAGHVASPNPPTPAVRRSPPRQVVRAASAPKVNPPVPAATEPKANVVQLTDVARHKAAPAPKSKLVRETRADRAAAETSPKKAALPKRRKPGLVKPA